VVMLLFLPKDRASQSWLVFNFVCRCWEEERGEKNPVIGRWGFIFKPLTRIYSQEFLLVLP